MRGSVTPDFQRILFPEIAEVGPLPLFPDEQFLLSFTVDRDRQPGNMIRKVYVRRSPTKGSCGGDVLLFYREPGGFRATSELRNEVERERLRKPPWRDGLAAARPTLTATVHSESGAAHRSNCAHHDFLSCGCCARQLSSSRRRKLPPSTAWMSSSL